MQFQDIEFTGSQTTPFVYNDADNLGATNRSWASFYGCTFETTAAAPSNGVFFTAQNLLVTDTGDKFFEFQNCSFTVNTTALNLKIITLAKASTTTTFLFNNCTYNIEGCSPVSVDDDTRGQFCYYDCTMNLNNTENMIMRFGADTAAPVNFGMKIDVRSCVLNNTNALQHGVLFGRNSRDVYFVNNDIFQSESTNAVVIGLVIKTRSTNVGDSIISGNYVVSPRPFYIKGGSKITAEYNTSVSNTSIRSGFDLDNAVDDRLDKIGKLVGLNRTIGFSSVKSFFLIHKELF
jgi:hypothetical protein